MHCCKEIFLSVAILLDISQVWAMPLACVILLPSRKVMTSMRRVTSPAMLSGTSTVRMDALLQPSSINPSYNCNALMLLVRCNLNAHLLLGSQIL